MDSTFQPERTLQATATTETYAGLHRAYEFFNQRLFAGVLPGALITLQREGKTFGYYSPERFAAFLQRGAHVDEIAMNPAYFGVRTIEQTLSTLVHECVHQWQEHVGKPGRGRYHNREWAERMEAIGLMPTSTGEPGGKRTGDRVTHLIMPAGQFEQACKELLTSAYRLDWFDRFPPPGHHLPIDPDDENGENDGEEGATATVAKNRNKIKFTCPVCRVNAWGKASLRLLCGGDECAASELVSEGL